MRDTFERLRAAVEIGHCLHGSRNLISGVIEPRQAHCGSGRRSGNLKAVYASRSPAEPCVMAMVRRDSSTLPYRVSIAWYRETIVVRGENATFRPGYVYVLSMDTFEWFEDELVSFKPVRPLARLTVTPAILRHFTETDRLDLRIPIPAPW